MPPLRLRSGDGSGNIYAPNKEDSNFFNEVNKVLGEMEGQIILAGDFNQVMDVFMDKSKFRGPVTTRDRADLHMLCEDLGLVDFWLLTNPRERDYTFFSHCQKSHSRIDFFLISSNIVESVTECTIHAMALSDHAAIELGVDINTDKERKGRWRLNTSLLRDEAFALTLGEDLKFDFDINSGSTATRAMEWEASKAFVRGKIIGQASKQKKEYRSKIKDLECQIRKLENKLSRHFSDKSYQDMQTLIPTTGNVQYKC